MKHLLFISSVVFAGLHVSIRIQAQANAEETGKTIATLLNATQMTINAAEQDKLRRQAESMDFFKVSLNAIKNGQMDSAYAMAFQSINTYHKFAAPYLIAAYISLQENDLLNAHRYLRFYKMFASRRINRDITKQIPAEFITQLKTSVENGFHNMSAAQLRGQISKENWRSGSLSIGVDVSARSFGDFYQAKTQNSDIKDFDLPVNFNITYTQLLSLSKSDAFSTVTKGSYALELSAGVDYQKNFFNDSVATRTQLFFKPALLLGRFYIVPFKYYKNFVSGYPNAHPLANMDIDYGSKTKDFIPEMRFYSFFSGYSAKKKGVTPDIRNPNGGATVYGYVFIKLEENVNSGSSTKAQAGSSTGTVMTTYYEKDQLYMAGYAVGTHRFELSFGFGRTDFDLESYTEYQPQNTQTTRYSISTGAFTGRLSFKWKLL